MQMVLTITSLKRVSPPPPLPREGGGISAIQVST